MQSSFLKADNIIWICINESWNNISIVLCNIIASDIKIKIHGDSTYIMLEVEEKKDILIHTFF